MKYFLVFVINAFIVTSAHAEDATIQPSELLFQEGETANLNEFLWIKRPIVVFADNPADPRFIQQMTLLQARPQDLIDRDVVVLTDTNPAAKSNLRRKLRPRGFMLALLAKDGTVFLRKPSPWDIRELSRSIDKLPLRKQELKDRRLPVE
jgi:hypothetical protein